MRITWFEFERELKQSTLIKSFIGLISIQKHQSELLCNLGLQIMNQRYRQREIKVEQIVRIRKFHFHGFWQFQFTQI